MKNTSKKKQSPAISRSALRGLMKEHCQTQRSLAAALGLDETRLSRILNGVHRTPSGLAERLAQLLGVDVKDVVS